jgi:hypothetical protein
MVNDKCILLSVMTLHKDYDLRCSIEQILAMSVKRLGANANWLAVNRDS